MSRSTLLHLRFPFSFFLLPVFLFALAVSEEPDVLKTWLVFFLLHFLVYPASNGYNSYFDKDKQSIGGLKNPPKVTIQLYWASLMLDVLALLLGVLIDWIFVLLLLFYGLVSKAYSHPAVRIKKMPILGLLTVGFFQGYFTFLLVVYGIGDLSIALLFVAKYQFPAILSSVLLLGSYPMTQIYQHEEDSARGDQTISLRLGILGTFHFTGLVFTLAGIGFIYYFINFYAPVAASYFLMSQGPVIGFFALWYFKVRKDRSMADYAHTMRLNFISALMFNIFFLSLIFL